jgi:integrase
MQQLKLTQTLVANHKLAKGASEEILFDNGKGGVPGLGLRVREGGSRKWIFQYRFAGQQRRDTIGDATAWALDAAREKARKMRVKVDEGIDPRIEKAERIDQSKKTLGAILPDYLEARRTVPRLMMKPRSYEEIRRHLEKQWKPLHTLPIGGIGRDTVAGRLREITKASGPVAADRARSSLSAFFAWCIGEGLCDTNPVMGTNKASDDVERERTLAAEELAAIWKGLPDSDYGRIVKLLILTMQRRNEIGAMQRAEVDLDEKVLRLPGERTKNHRPHDVPLSDLAIEILESAGDREGRAPVFGNGKAGFTDWSHSKITLDALIGLKERWTLHDLRRTGRTGLGMLGVAPHVAEAVLNHLPAKLIRTYDKNTYAKEKREALNLWAAHVEALITGRAQKVVPLRA